jgi:hypothetical protein
MQSYLPVAPMIDAHGSFASQSNYHPLPEFTEIQTSKIFSPIHLEDIFPAHVWFSLSIYAFSPMGSSRWW